MWRRSTGCAPSPSSPCCLFHGGYLQGGFLGVDLFFVLSGFLITSLLVRDARPPGRLRLGAFWRRRFRRLLPAVLTLIVRRRCCGDRSFGAARPSVAASHPRRSVGAVLPGQLARDRASPAGTGQSFAEPSLFDHLWSLAIEEQFYLVWPLVVVAIWRWSWRRSAAGGRRLRRRSRCRSSPWWSSTGGAIRPRVHGHRHTGRLAAPRRARRDRTGAPAGRGGSSALGGLVVVLVSSSDWSRGRGSRSTAPARGCSTGAGCSPTAGLRGGDRRCRGRRARLRSSRGLGLRPLAWIGVISYGLYLWHWPVYVVLVPERTGLDGVPLLVCASPCRWCSRSSFRLVEDPVRHRATWAAWSLRCRRARRRRRRCRRAARRTARSLPVRSPSSTHRPSPRTVAAVPPDVASPRPRPEFSSPPDGRGPARWLRRRRNRRSLRNPPRRWPQPSHRSRRSCGRGTPSRYDIAPALRAALTAGGWVVDDLAAYPGFMLTTAGREVRSRGAHGPEATWSGAELAILQISNWDVYVGSEEYAATLRDLSVRLEEVGTRLLVLSSPPTGDADFSAQLDRLFEVAAELALDDPSGNLQVIDARAVWGTPGVLDLDGDGTPERKRT